MRVENSFIPVRGVGEVTERKLWRSGVTAWEEFDGSVVGPTLAERIESFVDEARDHLRAGDATYFDREFPGGERWRLYENFRDEACFFDIETTGLSGHRDEVTTVSFHRDGETTTLVRGRDLTADRIRREFEAASLLVTFNGATFDVPFLEANFDLTVETPHLDVMYPCKQAGFSGGLSEVERAVGIGRERPDISGEDAVRLWYEYERGGDRDALDRLVSYNREDAENLKPVADAVTGILHDEVFETVRDE